MYKSPIEVLFETSNVYDRMIKEAQEAEENAIHAEIVRKFGVKVDKNELVKALRYDRNQYNAGYADGKRFSEIHAGWDSNDCCTNCGNEALLGERCDGSVYLTNIFSKYCPFCGARMDLPRSI